jgi:hypothetical protein
MSVRQKIALRWVLYALMTFFMFLLQTVVFPMVRPLGLILTPLPVAVVAVGMREQPEPAAIFSLAAGLLWCLSGGESGPLAILTITAAGTLASLLCTAWLTRSLLSSFLLSVMGLVLVEGGTFLVRLYLGTAVPLSALTVLLPVMALSLIAWPICYALCGVIGKVGR